MSVPAILAPEPGDATEKATPWAGSRLARLRGRPAQPAIGESWEFSTLSGSESRALGRALSDVLGRPLPFLAKLIDTARALSIQVHPDDDPSAGTPGKEEAWVVLAAEPGAEVLAGFRPGVTRSDLERMVAALGAARGEDGVELIDALERIPVRAGSVVLVPAGTVHAIRGGILLAEIQQPADCTYRLYDYGSGRPLHVADALAAARPDARPLVCQPDEPGRTLAGKHVHLSVLRAGRHALAAPEPALDRLIVPAGDGVVARADGVEHVLGSGELRLWTSGELELELPAGGTVVVGEVR